jgi:hypothetical protein
MAITGTHNLAADPIWRQLPLQEVYLECDTFISNTLDVTAQWNTNNAGNSIYTEVFTLNKIY